MVGGTTSMARKPTRRRVPCASERRGETSSAAPAAMNSRRFIRSSRSLRTTGRRVSRLDCGRTHCGCKCCVANAARGARRLWIIRVTLTLRRSLPIYPDKQTFLVTVGMSQKCQNRTHALRQKSFLFDHLVGQREQRGRHGEAERIRGLTINDEFELCWQLDG